MEQQIIGSESRRLPDGRVPGASSYDEMDTPQARMAALLEATAGGDRKAFELLYRQSSPRLYALCARLLRRHDLAEEVLQETFVQVWRKASEYDAQRAQPMTWMGRIARNRAIDVLRSRKHEVETGSSDTETEQTDTVERGPEEQSLDWQRDAAITRCLEILSAVQREAVLLAFFRGFTHGELAGVLAVPIGTVKGRIRQGLQRLKGCLES